MKFPEDVPTLTNGDVTLRAHRPGDAQAAVEQSIDPTSIQWTTVPLDYTLDNARSFVGEIMPRGWETESEFGFAIETTHPDGERRYSGTLSLRDEGSRRAEIAFGAHPAIRGRGVMSTAVTMLLDWGFKSRGPRDSHLAGEPRQRRVASGRLEDRLHLRRNGTALARPPR